MNVRGQGCQEEGVVGTSEELAIDYMIDGRCV